jgi:hypothetical protein
MAAVGGIIITKLQRFKAVNSIAWAFITVGFALMTQLKVDSNKGVQYGFQVVYALGAGVVRVLENYPMVELTRKLDLSGKDMCSPSLPNR